MPTSLKGKQSYISYSDVDLTKAVSAVKSGMSFGKAAAEFHVPKTTTIDRVNGRIKDGAKPGRPCELDDDLEKKVLEMVLKAADAGFPFTVKKLRASVGQLAKKLGLQTRFKIDVPGLKYWQGLKKRHPNVALRVAEALPQNRMSMINKKAVESYFNDLENLMDRLQLQEKPHRIWNMDETGKQFQHKPAKVIASRGQRSVSAKVSCN